MSSMNNPLLRAAAIEELVKSGGGRIQPQPFAESVVSCCEELFRAGEATLLLSLADKSQAIVNAAGQAWQLRLDILIVRALVFQGRFEEALALNITLFGKHADFLSSNPESATHLRITEAHCLWQLNQAQEAIDRMLAIRTELLRAPDSALLARCVVQLSSSEMRRGDFEQARRYALEGIVSARRAGDVYFESIALNNLGQIERSYGRWDSAEAACSEALKISEGGGFRFLANHARRSLAIVYWKRGRLRQAGEMAEFCMREAAAVSARSSEWYASLLLGMVRLHWGKFDEASALFTREVDWKHPRSESRTSLLTTEFLGDVQLERGQADKALAYYDQVWPEALILLPKGDIVAELRRRRAECYYLLGRHAEALEEAKVGLEQCREIGDRYEEAATYRVLGLAAAALGNPAEAKQWFDQGFAYYDDIETPYEWGKLWMAYGDWLRGPHAGEYADQHGALEAYYAARDQFERMGAEARLAEADERIASMRPRSTVDTAPAATTEAADPIRPRRRPRASIEIDRRSAWAVETFGFITRNRLMLDLLSDVGKLAAADAPMLILGESGTGKELIANGVHKLSGRKGQFVPINCANLPRDVIESELFGHVAGSFTGATRDKPGLFEICDGGTAFLDEIAEMPIELQARLLRFLETGEVRRVGSNRNVAIDSLVVAATNRDRAALEKGEGFRPDLYYRLAHAVVVIPPLRKRGEDVDLLVSHFLDMACRAQGKQVRLSAGARKRLVSYAWPGNVRQLVGALRRLVILGAPGQEIPAEAVHLDEADVASTLSEELLQAERRRMIEALAQARGSRSDAARALGMARTTLITKMKRYGIR